GPPVQVQPTVITMPYQPMLFNENPTPLHCPFCSQAVVTEIELKSGRFTWMLFFGMCILGCWCCACCALCAEKAKDVEHSCPNCKRMLGAYRRM
ncbi:hypothetical protein PFISCL1PPCAC_25089, partial [Pristionchus fissidentatus]